MEHLARGAVQQQRGAQKDEIHGVDADAFAVDEIISHQKTHGQNGADF